MPELIPTCATATLTWTSDDTTVAIVNQSGVVTGVAEGLVKIQVTAANGISSNPCTVTVLPPSGISDMTSATTENLPVFSLSGQRLAAPRKGVNIIGGKKVLIK